MSDVDGSGRSFLHRTGVGQWPRRVSLFALASDPGLNRLRAATAGALCVAAALIVEFALARVLALPAMSTTVFMLMGGIVAMLGANALVRADVRSSLRAAALFPLALGTGLTAGALLGAHRLLALAGFVVVMFAAVYIRRFGIDFFFVGFLVWIGYFFADFLHVQLSAIPGMLLAAVVATATVWLLCVTLLRPHPRRTMRRIFRSMDARSRSAARQCARLVLAADDPDERERALRRLRNARRRVREAALMGDGWAAVAPALPVGWSAVRLRRRLLGVQLHLERLCEASDALSQAERGHRVAAAQAIGLYAAGAKAEQVEVAMQRLRRDAQEWSEPARGQVRRIDSAIEGLTRVPEVAAEGPDQDPKEFEPAAALMLGNLPGSASVAKDVTARGRISPLVRLRLSTRQAVQVAIAGAVAIGAGSLLSPQRYYWAVIAAFVAFTGTGSRMETFRKSLNRVLGTLFGLFAGILLANLTAGHVPWALAVVIASIFCGFYLVRVSYSYMIFFITIMLAQLYGILGMFSDGLLILRLEETAIGAAVGIAVALLITPVSTRDTVAHASGELLRAISAVLTAVARRLQDPTEVSASRIDALMLAVDNGMRRLELVAEPLTRQFLWERRPREVRHRIALFAGCVYSTRELVTAAERIARGAQGGVVDSVVYEYARLAAEIQAGTEPESADAELERAVGEEDPEQTPDDSDAEQAPDEVRPEQILATLDASPPPAPDDPVVVRHSARLRELVEELARS